MVQLCDGAGFALKAFTECCSRSLDGNSAIEPRVTRFPHFAHASLADGGNDLVWSEFCAG